LHSIVIVLVLHRAEKDFGAATISCLLVIAASVKPARPGNHDWPQKIPTSGKPGQKWGTLFVF